MSKKSDFNIDDNLIRSLAEGDGKAFKTIYDRFAIATYRIGLKYLQSETLANELILEVFTNIWLDRKKFTSMRAFYSYMIEIHRRILKSYLLRNVLRY